jgi:hypothetical protein
VLPACVIRCNGEKIGVGVAFSLARISRRVSRNQTILCRALFNRAEMHQAVMRYMYEVCATWALGGREARSYQPRFIFLSIHPHQCDGHCIALHPTNAPPSSRPRPPELTKGYGRAQIALSSLFKPPNDIMSARGCASAAALHHGSDARDRGARRRRRSESLDSTFARREMSKMTSHR